MHEPLQFRTSAPGSCPCTRTAGPPDCVPAWSGRRPLRSSAMASKIEMLSSVPSGNSGRRLQDEGGPLLQVRRGQLLAAKVGVGIDACLNHSQRGSACTPLPAPVPYRRRGRYALNPGSGATNEELRWYSLLTMTLMLPLGCIPSRMVTPRTIEASLLSF